MQIWFSLEGVLEVQRHVSVVDTVNRLEELFTDDMKVSLENNPDDPLLATVSFSGGMRNSTERIEEIKSVILELGDYVTHVTKLHVVEDEERSLVYIGPPEEALVARITDEVNDIRERFYHLPEPVQDALMHEFQTGELPSEEDDDEEVEIAFHEIILKGVLHVSNSEEGQIAFKRLRAIFNEDPDATDPDYYDGFEVEDRGDYITVQVVAVFNGNCDDVEDFYQVLDDLGAFVTSPSPLMVIQDGEEHPAVLGNMEEIQSITEQPHINRARTALAILTKEERISLRNEFKDQ